MRQKQDIKGFTILELLVVITIVAVISAVGYPNFMDWRKDRVVRAAAEKVATMLTGISTQAQKGYFPFVQFQVVPGNSNVVFTSKGMTQDTMSIKLNQASTKSLDCTIVNSGYWDNHLVDTYTAEVGVNISGSGAVCFSKDGSYFSEKEDFNDPLDSIEENSEKIFGSYKQLIKMPEYKYIHPNKSDKRLQSPR